MKKLLLFFALVIFSYLAQAQSSDYHAFKFDLDFGYAIPSNSAGSSVKAGATFTLEPHYRLSDDFAVGLRIEGAALGYETDPNSDNSSVNISAIASYCATGDFYLANGGFRPYVGGGVGFFLQQALNVDENSGESTTLTPRSTKFGFFPRVGFEAGHFRVSASYNVLGNNSDYAAFTLGFFFGGGKK
jgi:opacity protein-like surface antigen